MDCEDEFSSIGVLWFSRNGSPEICFFSILHEFWFICSSVKGFTNMPPVSWEKIIPYGRKKIPSVSYF